MWKSDAPEVAAVQKGRVIALREGTATITASCGNASAVCVVTVTGELLPFTDLTAGAWYYDDIRFASEAGILNGMGDGRMEPNGSVTWPEALQIVYNLAQRPQTESAGDEWYSAALAWAEQNGLLDQMEFDAAAPIVREEMVTLLYRAARRAGGAAADSGSMDEFTDGEEVSDFAADAVNWAVGAGILKGDDNRQLTPHASLTRAQVAALLRRYIGILKGI